MSPHPPPLPDEFVSSDAPGRGRIGKMVVVIGVIVVALGWFAYRPAGPTIALAEEAAWSKQWNDSIRRSQASRKPPLVLYTADWCPACRWFESTTLVRGDVRSYMESRYTPIMVDLTRPDSPNQALAREYKIHAYPTLVLYDADGRELARTHALPPQQLLAWLRSNGRSLQ